MKDRFLPLLLNVKIWVWLALFCCHDTLPEAQGDTAAKHELPSRGMFSSGADAAPRFRLMSWNVKVGALFPETMRNPLGEEAGARVGRFGRILRAVRPDVLCLQEIWPLRETAAVVALLNKELPLEGHQEWFVHRATDVVIASRYPLKLQRAELVIHHPLPEMPDFHYGQAMCLVDLPDDRSDADVFVLTAHYRSRSGRENELKRERHSKSILDIIQDVRTPGGDLEVRVGTPIVIAGDFNVYESNKDDPKRHLQMLISGTVGVTDSPAKNRGLDWDGTEFRDLLPSINGRGKAYYTWRNDAQPYPPGALDRVLFTDSVLNPVGSFVLDAASLSSGMRTKYGLLPSDCYFAGREGVYDHLPIVVDFELKSFNHQ